MNQPDRTILILGYSETAMLLKRQAMPEFDGLVSIRGQRDPYLEAKIKPRLDLSFDDTPVIDEHDAFGQYRAREQRRKAAEIGLRLQPPTERDAQAIVEFAASVGSEPGTVLFQCFAGISRSSGAALIALAEWHGPGNEHRAVQAVFQARPAAQPHRGLVKLGDEALGRQGQLISELDCTQRGRL